MFRPVQFGKYYLTERLRATDQAELFKAKLFGISSFHRPMLVKQISTDWSKDAEFVAAFVGGAQAAVSLTHGNIVSVYELGCVSGIYFVTTEYTSGTTIADLLADKSAREGVLQVDHAVFIAMEVCKGLDYAHRPAPEEGRPRGVIHGGVNPSAIHLSRGGEVKISDFGVVHMVKGPAQPRVAPGSRAGRAYFSPEQISGSLVDHRTDIYSLGLVLHAMLTHHSPSVQLEAAVTRRDLRGPGVQVPSALNPAVPTQLDKIVLKAMAVRPEDRYPDANAFFLALRRFFSTVDSDATAATLASALAAAPHLIGSESGPNDEVEVEDPGVFLPGSIDEKRGKRRGRSRGSAPQPNGPLGMHGREQGSMAKQSDSSEAGMRSFAAFIESSSAEFDREEATTVDSRRPSDRQYARNSALGQTAPADQTQSYAVRQAVQGMEGSRSFRGTAPVFGKRAGAERPSSTQGEPIHATQAWVNLDAHDTFPSEADFELGESPFPDDPEPLTIPPNEALASADAPPAASSGQGPSHRHLAGAEPAVGGRDDTFPADTAEKRTGAHAPSPGGPAPAASKKPNSAQSRPPTGLWSATMRLFVAGLDEEAPPPPRTTGWRATFTKLPGTQSESETALSAVDSDSIVIPRAIHPTTLGWIVIALVVIGSAAFVLHRKTDLFGQKDLLDMQGLLIDPSDPPPMPRESEPAAEPTHIRLRAEPGDAAIFLHAGDAPVVVALDPEHPQLIRAERDGYAVGHRLVAPSLFEKTASTKDGADAAITLVLDPMGAGTQEAEIPRIPDGPPSGRTATLRVVTDPPAASVWLLVGRGEGEISQAEARRHYFMALAGGYEPAYLAIVAQEIEAAEGAPLERTLVLDPKSTGASDAGVGPVGDSGTSARGEAGGANQKSTAASSKGQENSAPAGAAEGQPARTRSRKARQRRHRRKRSRPPKRRRGGRAPPAIRTPSWAK